MTQVHNLSGFLSVSEPFFYHSECIRIHTIDKNCVLTNTKCLFAGFKSI